jgi:hypothetical protein
MKIIANLSMQMLKSRKAWSEVFRALNENKFNPKLFYPAKLSFKLDVVIQVFHDKQKLKQYMTTKPPLQKILQRILHTESENEKKNMKVLAIPNHRRRKGKKVESNIDSAAHNQTLKQQRQLNDRDHHIPINTNTEH